MTGVATTSCKADPDNMWTVRRDGSAVAFYSVKTVGRRVDTTGMDIKETDDSVSTLDLFLVKLAGNLVAASGFPSHSRLLKETSVTADN
jgi:hypothetical protein